jgi:hypothetical protein
MALTPAELDACFEYPVPPNEHLREVIRRQYRTLAGCMNELLPDGQDKTEALRHLQNSFYMAAKAVSHIE